VAVLDDEEKLRSALARLLEASGFEARLFETAEEFLAVLPSSDFLCVLLDLHMPHTSGFDVLQELALLKCTIPVFVITGRDEVGNAERVRALGAAGYLTKPITKTTLLDAIKAGHRSPPIHPASQS
jgi:two-component system response regulator FixJ